MKKLLKVIGLIIGTLLLGLILLPFLFKDRIKMPEKMKLWKEDSDDGISLYYSTILYMR